MNRVRGFVSAQLAASFLVLLLPTRGTGQSAASKSATSDLNSIWNLRRTPDGQPDLKGVWANASRVPLQRLEKLGAKEFYTEQEALENAKQGACGDRHEYSDVQYDLSQIRFGDWPRAFGAQPPYFHHFRTAGQNSATDCRSRCIPEVVEKVKGHKYDRPENRPLQERYVWAPDAGLRTF
jgi:hypothetical protein